MSNGWRRGPGRDNGPRATSRVVPCEAFFRNEVKVRPAPHSTAKPDRPNVFPEAVDMICLPQRLSRLQRSPEHRFRISQVWTTGLNGNTLYEGNASSSGVLLTDIAANRPPDHVVETPICASESPGANLLSPRGLQQTSGVLFRPNPKCSHIPERSQRSFLSHVISRLRSGLFCWRSSQRSSFSESVKEGENHSITEQPKKNKPVLKVNLKEVSSCNDFTSLKRTSTRKIFQQNHLKLPIPCKYLSLIIFIQYF